MSDDLQIADYGKTSIERSQNFEPTAPAPREIEEAAQEKSAFDAGVERLSAIDKAGERQPDSIQYNKMNEDGTRSNEKSDERLTVTPERAAADISDYRRGLVETEQAIRDIELATEIDRLRSGTEAAPQEPVALDQQVPQQQQPVQEPAPELPPELQGQENNELVKAFQREPALLSAVQTLSWQHEQKVAAAQSQAAQFAQEAQRQYAQQLTDNATAAAATVFSAFPELAGLSANDLATAIQVITKQNPERGMQIRNHITNVQALSAKAQEAQQRQAQIQQQGAALQFQHWASQQDDAWEADFKKGESPQRQTQIRNEAARMFREAGLSDQQIAHEWQTNSLLRSRQGQALVADAARWRLHQKTAQSIRPAPVPPVKVATPGSGGMRASEDDVDLRNLNKRLNESHSVKDAAALLMARSPRYRGNR